MNVKYNIYCGDHEECLGAYTLYIDSIVNVLKLGQYNGSLVCVQEYVLNISFMPICVLYIIVLLDLGTSPLQIGIILCHLCNSIIIKTIIYNNTFVLASLAIFNQKKLHLYFHWKCTGYMYK